VGSVVECSRPRFAFGAERKHSKVATLFFVLRPPDLFICDSLAFGTCLNGLLFTPQILWLSVSGLSRGSPSVHRQPRGCLVLNLNALASLRA
jgi:hypothetical protein